MSVSLANSSNVDASAMCVGSLVFFSDTGHAVSCMVECRVL